jgi:hypothetical protein
MRLSLSTLMCLRQEDDSAFNAVNVWFRLQDKAEPHTKTACYWTPLNHGFDVCLIEER